MPDVAPLETDAAVRTDDNPDAAEPPAEDLVEETLVEEISIDGMCGVY